MGRQWHYVTYTPLYSAFLRCPWQKNNYDVGRVNERLSVYGIYTV
ncbi:Uncharacterised protein [Serratia quinivorans]|nr:Uncharacterised protein [Serratia quinivorans]